MKRETAEKIIHDMIKPLYGFALKRCRTPQDAEDLAQEIAFKAFRSLTANGDIESPEKFIWTIAHNALSNYYRDKSKMFMGIPIDDLSETLRADGDAAEELIRREDISRLQKEIAYLSKIQRQIVIAYYYENKKQEEIADNLSIPLGTVKWHLFEAKKDLKKGISAMRETSELKFNPIKFKICGTSGSVGTKGSCSNFFRSTLSQNIVYSVWKIPKTVNEIADDLGVSPVYVESEAEYLYEYGFLIKAGGKYLCNILLDEPSDKINRLHDEMYKRAAKLFANELYDELSESPLLDDESVVVSSRMTGVKDDRPVYEHDRNFMLWALIPYIASVSGEQVPEIKPEEALTIRPDGGRNICYASVVPGENAVTEPEYFGSMQSFCGPCWNSIDGVTLWQCDSEWSKRRIDEYYQEVAEKSLSIIKRFIGDSPLSPAELAYMAEQGLLRTHTQIENNRGSMFITSQVVWIRSREAAEKLIAAGDRIKKKHKDELDALKSKYISAVLAETPKQLVKMQKYALQYIFYNDGWFLLHCLKELVNNGRLKPPAEEQRKSLSTVIIED